ncbi:MAG: adenine deaminase [Chloroflexi bacterium]|jgi:adenine deaminase|nr:adenine deaminase [Chloroflexota bacterium]
MSSSTKLTTALVDVAMGRAHADLVVKNGKWVSVQSGEIVPNIDIAVVQGRIAFVGRDAGHTVGKKTRVIDAKGKYLVPGLMDGHMHVESGMVTVTEFVRAVAVRGTTGMFIDPHEIANIFGLKGVKLMVDEAQKQPIHVWVQMPSCVPSAPGLETPGSSIGPKEVTTAMKWKGIIGLGEMMNFPGVFMSDRKMLDEMSATHAAGKTIGGHYASPDLGLPFHGYVAGGAEDDHEGTRMEDAIARVRQGMKAMLRYGSAWFDVAAQVKAITEKKLDSRRFLLVTDDSHAATLTEEGHMDRVLRHAVSEGLNPMAAIQMMTINTAEHFGLTKEMGMIAPGRWADILLVEDLMNFKADLVIAKGQVIAEDGEWQVKLPVVKYPKWATNSIHLKRKLTAADFALRTRAAHGAEVEAHVIGVIENQAPTRHLKMKVKAEDGEVKADIKRDIAKIALVERHKATGKVVVGLVGGFGFTRKCAIGSTVAHDSHHMIVVGNDDASMAVAANELANCGGGQIVVMDGRVIGQVEFPIAGLMSNERADVVAKKAATVLEGFKMCGSELNNPNMQLSLMALVVIPELRISDKGLVDVTKFDFVPVLED